MDTFEDLGLNPELVESLASEGLEEPTELQADLLPVLLRENSLLVRGGPGSGVPSACAAGLLQRTQAGPGAPLQGLVLVPVESEAVEFARSMARLALGTGHRVAALGGPFALPELAQVLVGTPDDILAEAESGRISLDSVHMVCALSADALAAPPETGERLEAVRALLARREDPVQWVMASEPVSPAVRAFADAHLKRAVHIPSDAAREVPPESPVRRGRLALQVVDTEVGTALAAHVSRLLDGEDVDHVLLFARTEDRAADLGDLLALHGLVRGAPGETDRPLWLGVD
ncbi:MAG: DEAD/DEAH box helicase, partial [Gemmatimonadales bacterium]